jgi:hypothetical protein
MPPRYPFPWRIALQLFWDILFKDILRSGQRDFQADALICTGLLSPPLKILNPENIPHCGPALLVTNHYARPGFQAWWIALAISASVPLNIHWMMTDAWIFSGPLTPLSRLVLTRVAQAYGFTATPPMPPHPKEIEERAWAVRRVLAVARTPGAVIALAPEGRDQPGGRIGPLPPGAGRFIEKIVQHCKLIVPIGVYEDDESLCLRFGPAFTLVKAPASLSAKQRDQMIGEQVMAAIAWQLPPYQLSSIFQGDSP